MRPLVRLIQLPRLVPINNEQQLVLECLPKTIKVTLSYFKRPRGFRSCVSKRNHGNCGSHVENPVGEAMELDEAADVEC